MSHKGITYVPPSILILIRRIEYWKGQLTLATTKRSRSLAKAMIEELTNVKKEVRETT